MQRLIELALVVANSLVPRSGLNVLRGLGSDSFAKSLVVPEAFTERDGVGVEQETEGTAEDPDPEMRFALVPAGDALHRLIEPVLDPDALLGDVFAIAQQRDKHLFGVCKLLGSRC